MPPVIAYPLDNLDRRLLSALDSDSRQSAAVLAKKLHLGSDLTNYRINRLRRDGVIERSQAIIDASRLGFQVHKVYLRTTPNRKTIDTILQMLCKLPNMFWVAEAYGAVNILFALLVREPSQSQRIIDSVLAKFSRDILGLDVFILTEANRFSRGFFIKQRGTVLPPRYAQQEVEIDDLELKLLHLLSLDSRQPIVNLAKKLRTTPSVVSYRIDKLSELGVICGYRLILGLDKLGLQRFRIQLHLAGEGPETLVSLQQFCERHPNVVRLARQLGRVRFEIDAEVEDFIGFNELVEALRDQIGGQLRELEQLLIRKEHLLCFPDLSLLSNFK